MCCCLCTSLYLFSKHVKPSIKLKSCSRGLQHFDSLPQQNKGELIKSESQIQQQIQQILLQGHRNEGLENGTSYSNVTVQSENEKKQMLVTQPSMFLNDVDREVSPQHGICGDYLKMNESLEIFGRVVR